MSNLHKIHTFAEIKFSTVENIWPYVQIGNVYDTDASFMTQLKDELQSFAEIGNTIKVTSGWDLLMTITFKL